MGSVSRWLDWTPSRKLPGEETSAGTKPSEPSKLPESNQPPQDEPGGGGSESLGVERQDVQSPNSLIDPGTKPTKPAKPDTDPHLNARFIEPDTRTKPTEPSKPDGKPSGGDAQDSFVGSDGFVRAIDAADAGRGLDVALPSAPTDQDTLLEEVEHWKRIFEPVTLEERPSARPVVVAVVRRFYTDGPVLLTLVRHGCTGPSRSGQDPIANPFALINWSAWRKEPFDLRLAKWYPSREAAVAGGEVQSGQKPQEGEEELTTAIFTGGVRVTLQRQAGRWLMFVNGKRRTDFATPFLSHARQCAEHFYGQPIGGWHESDSKEDMGRG